jgi:hypothetical protein
MREAPYGEKNEKRRVRKKQRPNPT